MARNILIENDRTWYVRVRYTKPTDEQLIEAMAEFGRLVFPG